MNGSIPTAVGAVALEARRVLNGDTRHGACSIDDEIVEPLRASCVFSQEVWWQVFIWIQVPVLASFESLSQLISHCFRRGYDKKKEKAMYAICLMTTWYIWLHRNNKVFNAKNTSVNMVVEEIKTGTFWWISA
ncbi:hypothetical protein Hdeb2414_s0012g00378521 [Helianthus debilis subsp. tardiflorus]